MARLSAKKTAALWWSQDILCKTKICKVYIKMASGKPWCLEENVKQQ